MTDRYPQRRFTPPPGSTEVLLIRHGASAHAEPGKPFDLLDGHADPPLSPEGEDQAVAVARRLDTESLAGIFITPLQRTAQTAQALITATGLEPVVVPGLREVLLGDWEGGELRIRASQGDPLFWKVIEEERWDVIPNAEPAEEFADRVRRGLEMIVATAGPDVTVAAVLHGGVIGEICRQATRSRPFAFVHADNCSISRLIVLPGGRQLLRSFNDTAHLDI